MNKSQSLDDVCMTVLFRSMYVLAVPAFLMFLALACTGQLANMQINDEPVYSIYGFLG